MFYVFIDDFIFFGYMWVLIIGLGLVGYMVVVYVSCVMLLLVLIQGMQLGGQLIIIIEVENWFGEIEIQGFDLMVKMEVYVCVMGVCIFIDMVMVLDLFRCFFIVQFDLGVIIMVDVVIFVIGVQVCWLGLVLEEKFKGFGVLVCVICDGFFYCNCQVVVIGGGNIVVEEVLFLINFVSKVMLVYCCDSLWVEKILQDCLFKYFKIEVIWDYELVEVQGESQLLGVIGICLCYIFMGVECSIVVDGVFIVIGYLLVLELVKDQLELYDGGYVKVELGSICILIFGVFVVGDLIDYIYCQVVISVGMGCMVVLDVECWLVEYDMVGQFDIYGVEILVEV